MFSMFTVPLNHEKIKKDLQRITKIKPLINKYNWQGINFISKQDDSKKFEKNNGNVYIYVYIYIYIYMYIYIYVYIICIYICIYNIYI